MSDQVPAEKPTVKSLHDRMMSLEMQVKSLVEHIEGSLGFKVARPEPDQHDEAPADPNDPA